jgi:hypothetical protein
MTMTCLQAGVDSIGRGWRQHANGKTYFIGKPNGLPGREGVDWGWTDKIAEAMELSPYWQRRFKADQRRCGYRVASPG